MSIHDGGAACFGLVLGWITYRTLRRKEGSAALSDLATVLGVVGGGTVTALFKEADTFAWYAIGLAVGFFLYLIIAAWFGGKASAKTWMGE